MAGVSQKIESSWCSSFSNFLILGDFKNSPVNQSTTKNQFLTLTSNDLNQSQPVTIPDTTAIKMVNAIAAN